VPHSHPPGATQTPQSSYNPNKPTVIQPSVIQPTGEPDGQRPSELFIAALFFLSRHSTEAHAEEFYDHYESNGWTLNTGRPLASWHAAARRWMREAARRAALSSSSGPKNFGASPASISPELNTLLNDPTWAGGAYPASATA
jgi:hypothetical protein